MARAADPKSHKAYLRFHLLGAESTYFSSFRVDSMNVGNGIIMKQGDIGVIVSDQPEL